MSDRIDISDLVKELCARAGVEYEATHLITITPRDMEITFKTRNRGGSYYVDKTTGYAAIERREVKVST